MALHLFLWVVELGCRLQLHIKKSVWYEESFHYRLIASSCSAVSQGVEPGQVTNPTQGNIQTNSHIKHVFRMWEHPEVQNLKKIFYKAVLSYCKSIPRGPTLNKSCADCHLKCVCNSCPKQLWQMTEMKSVWPLYDLALHLGWLVLFHVKMRGLSGNDASGCKLLHPPPPPQSQTQQGGCRLLHISPKGVK